MQGVPSIPQPTTTNYFTSVAARSSIGNTIMETKKDATADEKWEPAVYWVQALILVNDYAL